MEQDIAEYDERMSDPSFWEDAGKAQEVINEANAVKEKYNGLKSLQDQLEEYSLMMEMLEEDQDADMQAELENGIQKLQKETETYELNMLLSGPYDSNNAILEIHSGAGGTESQDWGSMLLRMYMRWAEKKGYTVETMDYQDGEEA